MTKTRFNVGARPGTLIIPEDSPPPQFDITSYNKNQIETRQLKGVGELQSAMKEDCINWVNVSGFGDEEVMKSVAELFKIHPLVLEDIVHVTQRPKVESYENHLFIIVKMMTADPRCNIEIEQVSILLGKNYVITFQERPGDVLDPIRNRLQQGSKRPIRNMGPDYLTYAIIDTIVDAYFPVLESIGDWLEPIDYKVINKPSPALLGELNRLKKQLVNLRRATWPQREAINSLLRDDHEMISEPIQVYLRDTYDHGMQITELTELYRDMISELMNTYMSSLANRTNEVMKVLTIVSTIFIPLTFLAGIYGMNFEYMPELGFRWSYPILWGIMLISAGIMFIFFWRKGWIGPQRKL